MKKWWGEIKLKVLGFVLISLEHSVVKLKYRNML